MLKHTINSTPMVKLEDNRTIMNCPEETLYFGVIETNAEEHGSSA
jgi:hypothetical protein